jgi:hypothetical protein
VQRFAKTSESFKRIITKEKSMILIIGRFQVKAERLAEFETYARSVVA